MLRMILIHLAREMGRRKGREGEGGKAKVREGAFVDDRHATFGR